MARKTDEIKNEYTNIALKAGSLQYEILCKQDDLRLVNDRLKTLNQEYIASSNVEAEVAKATAEAKTKEEAAPPAGAAQSETAEQPKQE